MAYAKRDNVISLDSKSDGSFHVKSCDWLEEHPVIFYVGFVAAAVGAWQLVRAIGGVAAGGESATAGGFIDELIT